ncbi:hypothetical protein BX600DRAFT_431623 [Xylariales sp. PMI_506]|nr:hypothetical protein BX600DRAFT_431623 [Xylariales sp. PMI_506]
MDNSGALLAMLFFWVVVIVTAGAFLGLMMGCADNNSASSLNRNSTPDFTGYLADYEDNDVDEVGSEDDSDDDSEVWGSWLDPCCTYNHYAKTKLSAAPKIEVDGVDDGGSHALTPPRTMSLSRSPSSDPNGGHFSVLRFPPETILMIVEEVEDIKDIASLRLTCKALNQLAESRFFRSICLRSNPSHAPRAIVNFFKRRPEVVPMIHRLVLDQLEPIVIKLIMGRPFPHLHTLVIYQQEQTIWWNERINRNCGSLSESVCMQPALQHVFLTTRHSEERITYRRLGLGWVFTQPFIKYLTIRDTQFDLLGVPDRELAERILPGLRQLSTSGDEQLLSVYEAADDDESEIHTALIWIVRNILNWPRHWRPNLCHIFISNESGSDYNIQEDGEDADEELTVNLLNSHNLANNCLVNLRRGRNESYQLLADESTPQHNIGLEGFLGI